MISRSDDASPTAETKRKLQELWKDILYLIIDETSMIGKAFLAKLSRNISIGKMVEGQPIRSHSFGGASVIICGDFHQFPPVAVGIHEALYFPSRPLDSGPSQLGRAIFEEFNTVVVLKEQMRVTDEVWRDFLCHLRYGRVQQHHIQMLRTLLIQNKDHGADFSKEPWNNAALVTPHHAVRRLWNEAALKKHAEEAQKVVFQCHAEDRIKGLPLTLAERYAAAARGGQWGGQRRRGQDLPDVIELAIGMKVMVTQNVQTDLDITNGARGIIVDIKLNPDEPMISEAPSVVKLKHLPLYILVKMEQTRASQLEGLEESVIPVEPGVRTFRINCTTPEGKTVMRTVKRRQFPMTSAYAYTDYRSQGQTIPAVLVDIATPPTGGLNLFNLYIALSCSSGRGTIRLLRDFNDELFMASHTPELLAEDDRLEELNQKTLAWWTEMGRDTRNSHTC